MELTELELAVRRLIEDDNNVMCENTIRFRCNRCYNVNVVSDTLELSETIRPDIKDNTRIIVQSDNILCSSCGFDNHVVRLRISKSIR